MVKLHSSRKYVKDPVDVWGKERTIGNAELAMRIKAPPITTIVDNGNVMWWDDFNSPTTRYELFTVFGGAATISTDYAKVGDASLKCIPNAAAGASVGPKYYLTDFHEDSTMSVKATFSSPDAAGWTIYLSLLYYDGTNLNASTIKYFADGVLKYYNSDGIWTSLTAMPRYDSAHNWGSINLSVDFSTKKYVSSRVFRDEHDMSSESMRTTLSGDQKHVEAIVYIEDVLGGGITGYINDVILMENV